MQFNKNLLTATLLTVAGLTAVSSANAAGTATGEFEVKIDITSVCSVVAAKGTQDIVFGTTAAGTLATDIAEGSSAAAITVKCSKNAPYVVNLKPSNNSTTGTGVMTGPVGPVGSLTPEADTVAYQLTKGSGTATNWGNEGILLTEGNGFAGIGLGLDTTDEVASYPVFAKVTGSTDVRPGAYSDLVAVTVTY